MGYHDVRLPTTFSEGSQFGPGFRTAIIELDNLGEQRIQRGPAAGRRTYSLERGIADLDDLYDIYEFFIARQGALNSFRLKDWLDYATTETGTTHRDDDVAVAYDDQDLVLVSGKTYQFVKRYTSGPTTVVRTLRKMVDGTVLVGDGGGLVSSSNYSIDLQNGQITFATAYSPSGQVTGGCQFDVCVRFAEETDSNLAIAIEALDVGNLPAIRCIEDVDPVVVSQDFPFGGSKNHGAIASDVTLSELDGRLQTFNPGASGRIITLPDPTYLPAGGPYFHLVNESGTYTMVLKDHNATTLVATWAAGAAYTIWLGYIASGSATKAWFIT